MPVPLPPSGGTREIGRFDLLLSKLYRIFKNPVTRAFLLEISLYLIPVKHLAFNSVFYVHDGVDHIVRSFNQKGQGMPTIYRACFSAHDIDDLALGPEMARLPEIVPHV